MERASARERVGLCADCCYMRIIRNDRGSVFYQCGKAVQDPNMAKYPKLPVLVCPHYVPGTKPEAPL